MIISDKKSEAELMAFVPSIKSNMTDWQIISVKVPPQGQAYYDATLKKLFEIYEHKEGVILPVSESKIMLIIRLGNVKNYALLKSEIESKLPKRDARVIAQKMSTIGLKQVQLNLSAKSDGEDEPEPLHTQREKREENVFLIAEDDTFVRKAICSALKKYGRVIESEDGANVTDLYTQHNPDIVLLDIHMPHKSGLTLVNEIIEIDMDAFIIIASADSVKDNVIEAISGGAIGFLTKPIKKEKLLDYLAQCMTCSGCCQTVLSD